MCMQMCVCVCCVVCLCGRAPEHQVSSSVAPHFISETGSFTDLASLVGKQAPGVHLPVFPVLGLQVHVAIPGFYNDIRVPNSVLMLAQQALN